MAKSLNKVTLIGNVGKDPEIRYTTSGVAVASFTMATSERWKDQEGNFQDHTEWHNIVAWRRLAEIVNEYVKKGNKLYIEGKIRNRSYDDKNGVKRYVSEILADDIILLTARPGAVVGAESGLDDRSEPSVPAARSEPSQRNPEAGPEDDLPF
ncbi:MAG: single-stranded DNA-binding protein [Ignavibacteriales bacterium CG07_land_8_20_14_0_80_59_12]|nr:MAG: single-stranded DNA-binding protein [Ignavibacteriales bacterium CG07_land_8_20_14_0_80_59_12]